MRPYFAGLIPERDGCGVAQFNCYLLGLKVFVGDHVSQGSRSATTDSLRQYSPHLGETCEQGVLSQVSASILKVRCALGASVLMAILRPASLGFAAEAAFFRAI